MSYIHEIPYEQASGRLREIYDDDLKTKGYIANMDMVLSLRPDVNDAWTELLKTIRSQMRLRRYELVTVAAAKTIGCRYCMIAHGTVLQQNFFSAEQVVAILKDYHQAGLETEEVALMDFATQVTRNAGAVTPQDIQKLRELGFSDADILDVTLAVAARNFFTRILEAMGAVPDAAYREKEPEIWAYVMGEMV